VHPIPFIFWHATITLRIETIAATTEGEGREEGEEELSLLSESSPAATVTTAPPSDTPVLRSKSRRIVISEHNYLSLREMGKTGDTFNDVIIRLLRTHRLYQEEKQRQLLEEEKAGDGEGDRDDDNDAEKERFLARTDKLPFITSGLADLFGEHDRQLLANLLAYGNRKNNCE
jgi:hypothetical protein